jgi:hypothetical protein
MNRDWHEPNARVDSGGIAWVGLVDGSEVLPGHIAIEGLRNT